MASGKGEGLSSREAQHRLLDELAALLSHHSTVKWLEEIKQNPHSVIWSCLTGAAGLIMVIYFAVTAVEEANGAVLFQSLFLIFLAAFNVALFGWEVYILKIQKIRHLIARLKPFFDRPCLWTSSDYPRSPMSTLRGELTVPTYRDGVLVNVPISLLVSGDLIELDSGIPCPANAVVIGSNSRTGTGHHVAANEEVPEHFFKDRDIARESDSIRFLPNVKPVKLRVKDSPILPLLENSVQRSSSVSFLTRETNLTLRFILIALTAVYFISLIINIIRLFSLPDDFDASWPELLLGLPICTSLPLLLPQLPLVWSIMNLYGTARVSQLVDHGPLCLQASKPGEKIRLFYQTLKAMFRLLFWCSHYPDYRMFHVLGTLTSVCAVDKEYLLTSGGPSPEKVLFLRTEDVAMEEARARDIPASCSTQNLASAGRGGGGEGGVKGNEGGKGGVGGSGNGGERGGGLEGGRETKETLHLAVPEVRYGGGGKGGRGERDKKDLESHEISFQIGSPPEESDMEQQSRLDSCSAVSFLSDSAPFELVTEILNISPDLNNPYSGIAFDDINWHTHIGSLKPIGVNLLATSHLTKVPSSGCHASLKHYLHKSNCACSLGMEIGVSEYLPSKFEQGRLLYSLSDANFDFNRNVYRKCTAAVVQPHLISSVVKDIASERYMVMSRGSGDMIALCCNDFWDGKDLQPMTDVERMTIVDYYNSRSLSSYCIALAYNPLPDVSRTPLAWKGAVYIPPSHLEQKFSGLSLHQQEESYKSNNTDDATTTTTTTTAEDVFKNLQYRQVFLGLVCLQFKPKQDIVTLVEDLYMSGIRFVHFTAENELRAKIFAQKLGLEADWNCFISLAPPTEDENTILEENLVADEDDGGDSGTTSLASSVLSVFNVAMSNRQARLPKGIKNIRPHILSTDNVPLLVSLFTDCTAETITEMIEIMQENSEVVLCIGNAWNHMNLQIFSQADISLSVIPHYVDLPNCTMTETCALSTSNSSQNMTSFVMHEKESIYPTPLELASYLNSVSCQLCFGRDSDVSLLSLITESRQTLFSIRLGLLFGLGASVTLSTIMVFSNLFFLPPPLSCSHLLWFLIFILPLMVLTFLATPLDPKVKSYMPNKKKDLFSEKWLVILENIFLFVSTGVIALILFGLTLNGICVRDISNSTCHLLLGNRRAEDASPWNGWRGPSEQGLLFAQDLTAFFVSIYLVVLSIRYVHRTRPIWRLWKFTSWQYIAVTSAVVLLQVLYFAMSQSISGMNHVVISGLGSVPVSVWCVGFFWPFMAILILEGLKYMDKRKLFETQTLLRLKFGTKLGMHSPYN